SGVDSQTAASVVVAIHRSPNVDYLDSVTAIVELMTQRRRVVIRLVPDLKAIGRLALVGHVPGLAEWQVHHVEQPLRPDRMFYRSVFGEKNRRPRRT
ncbi:MAG TPA: hypothetical protein VGM78_15085, partial [Ilumatobacteraceae bacterium]